MIPVPLSILLLIINTKHTMSYQPDNEKLYHSDRNFVAEKYNPSTSSASGSCTFKHIYRKTDPNYRKEILSRERKRRCAQISQGDVQICYISSSKEKQEGSRAVNSRVRDLLSSPRNSEKREKDETEIHKKTEELVKNPEKCNTGKRMKSRSKTDKLSQALQIQELRLLKISLNRQIRTLKHDIEMKDKKIQYMESRISQLTQQLKQDCTKCEQKSTTITELRKIIQEQRGTIEQQQFTIKTKNQCNTGLYAPQDIERLLSDVHKTFQDMEINESRLQQVSVISNQQNYQQTISNLRQKVKYLEIELAMMKKYRFDQHRIQEECEKYRVQNKFLFSKIRNLHEQKQKKNYCDYSISFDLSREEEGSSIVL